LEKYSTALATEEPHEMKYRKITISGKICTGKSTLFKDLRKTLHWTTISTSQIFRARARKNSLSLEKADEQDDVLTQQIDHQVRDTVLATEKIIAEGWMTGIMTVTHHEVLRILLTSDDQKRVERFMEREGVSFEEAEKRVKDRETLWIEKVTVIYNRSDFFDPKHYNLVIDTTNATPLEVLNEVLQYI